MRERSVSLAWVVGIPCTKGRYPLSERSIFGFPAHRPRFSAWIIRFCKVSLSADGAWGPHSPGLAAAPESATLRERSVFGIEKPEFLRERSVSGGLIDQVSLISLWTPCSTGAPRSPVLAREVGIRRGSRGPPPPLLAPNATPCRFPRTRTTATLDPPFGSLRRFPETARVWYISRAAVGARSHWTGNSPPLFLCLYNSAHSNIYSGSATYFILRCGLRSRGARSL